VQADLPNLVPGDDRPNDPTIVLKRNRHALRDQQAIAQRDGVSLSRRDRMMQKSAVIA
jgi:hypothetical protein